MFLRGVHGCFIVLTNDFGVVCFAPLLLFFRASWIPFWRPSGQNLAKRVLAGSFGMIMIFLAAGPLFEGCQPLRRQKGVQQQEKEASLKLGCPEPFLKDAGR